MELDRQGRSYRRFGKVPESVRFTGHPTEIGRCSPALKTHLAHVHAHVPVAGRGRKHAEKGRCDRETERARQGLRG